MEKKSNWQDYKAVLDEHRIVKLYHFTDFDNLESIIKNGGLYSWMDCERKGIKIAKPGGGNLSRQLDSGRNLEDYVRVSFTTQHPMMYVAMKDGRISNPVILEIDPEVIYWKDSCYSNMNATIWCRLCLDQFIVSSHLTISLGLVILEKTTPSIDY